MYNEEGNLAANKEHAAEMMSEHGYAPNPYCKHCNGFGKVHPVDRNGKTIWAESVMCGAPGCLSESFKNFKYGH
jgi:hypothetical protein